MATDKNHADSGKQARQRDEAIPADERVRKAQEMSPAKEEEQARRAREEESRVEGEVTGEERVEKHNETVRQGHDNPETEAERRLEEEAHQPERKESQDDASMTGLPGFGGKTP